MTWRRGSAYTGLVGIWHGTPLIEQSGCFSKGQPHSCHMVLPLYPQVYTPQKWKLGLANTLDIKQSLCTRAKTWKWFGYPAAEEQITTRFQISCIFVVEYHSALKRNGVWTHARTCRNLDNTMLRERRQSQEATYHVISSRVNVQNIVDVDIC